MLTKVIEIGKAFESEEIYRNLAEPVTIEKGIVIVFNADPIQYVRTRIDEKPIDSKSLLYVSQKGNIFGKSCTVNLSLSKGEKELREDVQKTFKKLCAFFKSDKLQQFKNELEMNQDSILEEIVQRSLEFKQKGAKSAYVSVCVKVGEEELRPAEYDPFKEQFIKQMFQKAEKTAEEGVCAFCGEKRSVSSTVNEVFTFATFDKPGFCPNLRKRDAVKVLPVCNECKTYLKNGANKLMHDLAFDFLNVKLWVLPSLLSENREYLLRVVKSIENTSKELKNFAQNERKIENALSQFDERVFYDFLFMHIDKSQQKIELHITQISPTRLKTLVDKAQSLVERLDLNENEQPNLLRIWLLYQKPTGETQGKKDYLELVRCIFQGENYNHQRFLWYCMRTIRKNAFTHGDENVLFAVGDIAKQVFACVLYLNEIGVFKFSKGESSMESGSVQQFFEKFPEFFNQPWKKAVFLTGVLTGRLLSVQYVKRRATPFFSKLKGLKMNLRDVQGLLPEIRNKFQQYKSFSKRLEELIQLISQYYLQSADSKISTDELNFVFTLGLSYANVEPFKTEMSEEGGGGEENG